MTDTTRLHHRDAFLNNLTQKLGRERRTKPTPFSLSKTRQHEILRNTSSDEQLEVFVAYAQSKLGVYTYIASETTLMEPIKQDCLARFGDQPGNVLVSRDPRLGKLFTATPLTDAGFSVTHWQPESIRRQQIRVAEQAQIGIVFAEQALVESGTVVLESSNLQNRAISLLPRHSIFVIRKSSLLPRISQACEAFHQRVQQGERLPSCINFISGPSSTADIELIKVVGVHGPVSATYIILDEA